MKYLVVSLLSLLTAWSAQAELTWKTTEISTHGSGKTISAKYHFKNEGPDTVRIYDIRGSCPCVNGTADKADYKKGEEGDVTAVFTVGQKTGMEKKMVYVRTLDKQAYILTLIVSIDRPDSASKKLSSSK